jgi:signal transduction histidine kinase
MQAMHTAAPPAKLLAARRACAAMNPAQLAIELERARAQEREHLAREFHDVLGGLLTAARLDVAGLQQLLAGQSVEIDRRLGHLNDTLRAAFALKRRIVDGLAPASLHGVGLVASLEAMAREFVATSGIRLSTRLDEVVADEAMQLAIYRLVQESLTNIAKYANARAADIVLRGDGNGITVEVSDDGQGFDPALPRTQGHGLDGMRHRVESAGGHLAVESSPGGGTRIRAEFAAAARAAGAAH